MPNPRICSVEGCGNVHKSRGYCHAHYQRLRVHGDPLRGGPSVRSRAAVGQSLQFIRDALKAETDECTIWPFVTDTCGYGKILLNGKFISTHRLVCIEAHGPPPLDKNDAAHFCGNPPCINKRHLRWASRKENMADMLLHGTRDR